MNQLDALKQFTTVVAQHRGRAPDAASAKAQDFSMLIFDEAGFRFALNHDAMVTEKLAEGICVFALDAVKLEQLMQAA